MKKALILVGTPESGSGYLAGIISNAAAPNNTLAIDAQASVAEAIKQQPACIIVDKAGQEDIKRWAAVSSLIFYNDFIPFCPLVIICTQETEIPASNSHTVYRMPAGYNSDLVKVRQAIETDIAQLEIDFKDLVKAGSDPHQAQHVARSKNDRKLVLAAFDFAVGKVKHILGYE